MLQLSQRQREVRPLKVRRVIEFDEKLIHHFFSTLSKMILVSNCMTKVFPLLADTSKTKYTKKNQLTTFNNISDIKLWA